MSQSEGTGTLSLRLLGPPQIELDGAPVKADTRKATALLAYLAATGQAHSRESLAALLWSEYDQERAYANLRRTLWALNKAVGKEWLETSQDTIRLARAGGPWLDVDEFHRYMAECRTHDHARDDVCPACLAPLAQAVALYRDDFLAGFTLRDSPAFDEWQFFEADGLRGELASALERLVRGHAAQGDLEQAIDYARRWLALDSLHEPAHRELMRLYAWDGRRAAALRQFQECARVLDEELGALPDAETTRLHQAIQRNELLSSDPATPPSIETVADLTPGHNLPPQPTPFVGRNPELAEIAELFRDPGCRLLTLVGPGGVGKTRLALQAGKQAILAFPHGVHFVSLAPLESSAFLVPTIAHALGFTFFQREGVEPKQQLFDFLREKELLLILDNFEHLADGAGLLADLLGQAPGVKVLVTSRERLYLRGEWVVKVGGMRYPRSGDGATEALADYSAVQLFLQHASRAHSGFAPVENDWQDLVRICQLLEGMPLGIELAAAWVRLLSCHEIADEIEQGLDFLSASLRDAPERHRSLRAVFDHSWQLLAKGERAALARLSVFRGGFEREAAQQVAGASLPVLVTLADKSLLRRNAGGRYEMHEAVRQYAAERLAAVSGEETAVRDMHCVYYAAYLDEREGDLRGGRQLEALDEVAHEIENVRAAWRWAVTQAQVQELRQAANSMSVYYQVRSLFQEGEEAFGEAASALEAARGQNRTEEIDRTLGFLWAYQGWFADWIYDQDKAQALLQRSIDLLSPLGMGEELASAYLMSVTTGLVQDVSEAEKRLWESHDYYQSTGSPGSVGLALDQLNMFAQLRGDLASAKGYLHDAIANLTQAGHRWGIATALFSLGSLAQHQKGQRAEAKHYYEESLKIRRELGDQWGKAICLDYIGFVAREMGQYDESRQLHEESLAVSRQIGDQLGIAGSLDNLGLVACDEGDFVEARRCFEEGLSLRRQVGRRLDVAISMRHMGDAALGQEDLAGAEQWYGDALQTMRDFWEQWGSELLLVGLAEVALGREDTEASKQYLQEALQICVENRMLSNSLRTLVGVARLLAETDRSEFAAGLLAYVQEHQASTLQTRETAKQLLDQLAAELQPGSIETTEAPLEGITVGALLEQVLAEL